MAQKRNPDATRTMRALRLYGLLLFSGRAYSLGELAERFGCSKPTILRDIEAIEAQHDLPVQLACEQRGREHYYSAMRAETPPNVSLSPDSLRHLMLCRDLAGAILPRAMWREIEETAVYMTPRVASDAEREAALSAHAHPVPRGAVDYGPHEGTLRTLLRAIREKRVCRVGYVAAERDAVKRYRVGPLRLLAHGQGMYLSAVYIDDAGKQPYPKPMRLAVHRIRELQPTELRFRPEEAEELPPGDAFGMFPGEPFRVRVRFSAKLAMYVSERLWSRDQRIEPQADGGVILEMQAASPLEVVPWVLSFGPDAELLAPKDLREEVKARLRESLRRY